MLNYVRTLTFVEVLKSEIPSNSFNIIQQVL